LVAARVQLKNVADAKPLPFLLLQEECSRGFFGARGDWRETAQSRAWRKKRADGQTYLD
jgi:hypothetical protein